MDGPDTRTRILDAALAVIGREGLARLSVERVARQAGVSRQTVYRYVGSRDGLVTATILREETAFLDALAGAAHPELPLREALAAAIRTALVEARRHPLLGRLLQTEPGALLPFLTDGRGPVLSAAKTVVADLLARRFPGLAADRLDLVAEAATRLLVSYAISPPDDDLDGLASGLADLLAGGVEGVAAAGVVAADDTDGAVT